MSHALSLRVLDTRLVLKFMDAAEKLGSFHLSDALSLRYRPSSSCLDPMVGKRLLYFWGPRQHLREGKGRKGKGEGKGLPAGLCLFIH